MLRLSEAVVVLCASGLNSILAVVRFRITSWKICLPQSCDAMRLLVRQARRHRRVLAARVRTVVIPDRVRPHAGRTRRRAAEMENLSISEECFTSLVLAV